MALLSLVATPLVFLGTRSVQDGGLGANPAVFSPIDFRCGCGCAVAGPGGAMTSDPAVTAFEEGLRSALGELADIGPSWERTARSIGALMEVVDLETPAWFRGAAWNQLERLIDDVVGAMDWDAVSPDAALAPALADHLRTRSVNEVQAVAAAIAQLSIDLLRLGAARRALETGLLPP